MYKIVILIEIEIEIGLRTLFGKSFMFADFSLLSGKTKILLKQ